MSRTIDYLMDRNADPEVQRQYFGLVPTPENAKKVLLKADSFGKFGIKGFDLAIATFAILRGEEDHEQMPVLLKGVIEMFSRPFNFAPRDHDDLGLLRGYTYGLHILPKHMGDVDLRTHEAANKVAIIAGNSTTERVLLAQQTSDPQQAAFENGYFGVYPSNVSSVISYLVLPKADAIEIIKNANSNSLV